MGHNSRSAAPGALVKKVPAGRYRHYKGRDYEVIGVAQHSETEEDFVVYRRLYGDFGLSVRPLAMFVESVEVGGETVPRFSLIEEYPGDGKPV